MNSPAPARPSTQKKAKEVSVKTDWGRDLQQAAEEPVSPSWWERTKTKLPSLPKPSWPRRTPASPAAPEPPMDDDAKRRVALVERRYKERRWKEAKGAILILAGVGQFYGPEGLHDLLLKGRALLGGYLGIGVGEEAGRAMALSRELAAAHERTEQLLALATQIQEALDFDDDKLTGTVYIEYSEHFPVRSYTLYPDEQKQMLSAALRSGDLRQALEEQLRTEAALIRAQERLKYYGQLTEKEEPQTESLAQSLTRLFGKDSSQTPRPSLRERAQDLLEDLLDRGVPDLEDIKEFFGKVSGVIAGLFRLTGRLANRHTLKAATYIGLPLLTGWIAPVYLARGIELVLRIRRLRTEHRAALEYARHGGGSALEAGNELIGRLSEALGIKPGDIGTRLQQLDSEAQLEELAQRLNASGRAGQLIGAATAAASFYLTHERVQAHEPGHGHGREFQPGEPPPAIKSAEMATLETPQATASSHPQPSSTPTDQPAPDGTGRPSGQGSRPAPGGRDTPAIDRPRPHVIPRSAQSAGTWLGDDEQTGSSPTAEPPVTGAPAHPAPPAPVDQSGEQSRVPPRVESSAASKALRYEQWRTINKELPASYQLKPGDNPWWAIKDQLKKIVPEHKWTNAELLAATKVVARDSHISVPEWHLAGQHDHRHLQVGFELTFDKDHILQALPHQAPQSGALPDLERATAQALEPDLAASQPTATSAAEHPPFAQDRPFGNSSEVARLPADEAGSVSSEVKENGRASAPEPPLTNSQIDQMADHIRSGQFSTLPGELAHAFAAGGGLAELANTTNPAALAEATKDALEHVTTTATTSSPGGLLASVTELIKATDFSLFPSDRLINFPGKALDGKALTDLFGSWQALAAQPGHEAFAADFDSLKRGLAMEGSELDPTHVAAFKVNDYNGQQFVRFMLPDADHVYRYVLSPGKEAA